MTLGTKKILGISIICLSLFFFLIVFFLPKNLDQLKLTVLLLGIGTIANGIEKIYGDSKQVFWSRISTIFLLLSVLTALGTLLLHSL